MTNDNNTEVVLDTPDIPAIPEIPEAEHPAGIEMIEWVFTNDKTNPYPRTLFHGLYQGAFANKLGIMQAMNKNTGEVDTVIVGVELVEGQPFPNLYPLAKILKQDELEVFQAPDGNGDYV